jgi:hypothetical protein
MNRQVDCLPPLCSLSASRIWREYLRDLWPSSCVDSGAAVFSGRHRQIGIAPVRADKNTGAMRGRGSLIDPAPSSLPQFGGAARPKKRTSRRYRRWTATERFVSRCSSRSKRRRASRARWSCSSLGTFRCRRSCLNISPSIVQISEAGGFYCIAGCNPCDPLHTHGRKENPARMCRAGFR